MGTCVQAAAVNTDTPIIVVLVHGGPLDVSWLEKSDRISGILSAWYPGQVITPCSLSDNPLSVPPLCVTCKTARNKTEQPKRAQNFLPAVQIFQQPHKTSYGRCSLICCHSCLCLVPVLSLVPHLLQVICSSSFSLVPLPSRSLSACMLRLSVILS